MTPSSPLLTAAGADPGMGVAANGVAIASGKGGVGKTWFAITLAHALARAGRRTLLFDGDLGLANVDIQLGLSPEFDLGAILRHGLPLSRGITSYAPAGFDVLAGQSGTGTLASMTAGRLHQVCDALVALAPAYDHLVVDLGAGVERTVRHLASRCRTCIVLITDEPTSLTDAYAFVKLLAGEAPRMDFRVVVNMARSRAEGERSYLTLLKACQAFLKLDPRLAGTVRRDPRVKESIRHQTPLMVRHPSSPAAEDVAAVAAALLRP